MIMMRVLLSFCLLAQLLTAVNCKSLRKVKSNAGHGGRKSVVIHSVNPVQRSAWECHPGCKRFCLSSCKRSCCALGAPNYSPAMFPQLVNYQASLPPPPPPPPACPAGCPSTCYPNCDSGCCFQANQPVFPQYANPYDVGYTGYPAGDPCAAMSCSAACAPQCKPDCCRSQALNLSIRPVYLGGVKAPPKAPKPPPPPKPPVKTHHKKKAMHTKPQIGSLCVPQCQTLCKPICRFDCCLATHKFHKKQSDHKPSSSKPQEPPKPKVHHDITPVASPQRVPIPKLFAMANPSQEPAQDAQQSPQPSPYEGYQYQDAVAPVAPTAGITCPGSCPLACAPSCQWSCCAPFQAQPAQLAPQAFPYGAVPSNPLDASQDFRALGSPGLRPVEPLAEQQTCPAPSCPDTCAPLCSRSCCAGLPLLPLSWDKRAALPHRG